MITFEKQEYYTFQGQEKFTPQLANAGYLLAEFCIIEK